MHELVPRANAIAFLVNPNNAVAELGTSDVQAAADTLGKKLIVVKAGTKDDLNKAFGAINGQHGGVLVVQTDPFFLGQRDQIVALAAQHAVPAIYYLRDYPAAGGLMSYGTSLADALRLVGNYTGRILKGEKPGDLSVQQSVKTELLAQSGHPYLHRTCPLSGVKRTWRLQCERPANDPSRTSASSVYCLICRKYER